MTDKFLHPNIDRRLEKWMEARKKKGEAKLMTKPTITISRKFGCEAYPLAEKLQEILEDHTGAEWNIFDNSLIDRVSRETEISKDKIGQIGSGAESFDFFSIFSSEPTSYTDIYSFIVDFIERVAKEGNAIIVGRGAALITKSYKNCFHFRLDGAEEFRIQSIVDRLGKSHDEAAKMVRENQKQRERFIRKYFSTEISDPLNFHAVFNNGRASVDMMAKAIVPFVERFGLE